jgi:CubicO group peptidase (beta-lactamase class C family)
MAGYLGGLASSGRFSGTVLIAQDGRVLLDAGYGLADRAARVRNGPGTIFQVGSVTKQFTAMAIAILAARGRLRLAGQACAYLPRCPPAWGPITIAELLDHTSGIALVQLAAHRGAARRGRRPRPGHHYRGAAGTAGLRPRQPRGLQ